MPEPSAQRTLVKSPPELWAEVSDVESLARHLGEFGEIRITRLDPETTVAWEGDRARGTVALEPSGWGTKVTLTAELAQEAEPAAAEEPEPLAAEPAAEPEPLAAEPEVVAVEPEPEPEPEPLAAEPEPLPAEAAASEPEPLPAEPAASEPEPLPTEPAAEQAPKKGFFARLFGRKRRVEPVVEIEAEPEPLAGEPEPLAAEPELPAPEAVAAEPEPEPPAPEPEPPAPEPLAIEPEPPAPEPPPPTLDAERAHEILVGVLDDLGSAHHRPFSRS